MNKNQKARLATYTLPLAHLHENKSLYENMVGFLNVVEAATSTVSAIQATDRRREMALTGVKENKEEQHQLMVDSCLSLGGIIHSWASIQGLTELKDKTYLTRSALLYAPSTELHQEAQTIADLLRSNAEGLKNFGITEAVITSFEADVLKFGSISESTRDAITDRKGDTNLLGTLFREANKIFEEQLDPLMQQFRITNPGFHDLYFIKRAMVNPGSRSTGAGGVITDAVTGLPLKNAVASVTGSALQVETDEEGRYNLAVPIYGEVGISFTKAGYKAMQSAAMLKKGKTTELNVALVPQ